LGNIAVTDMMKKLEEAGKEYPKFSLLLSSQFQLRIVQGPVVKKEVKACAVTGRQRFKGLLSVVRPRLRQKVPDLI
jgi:hypothetical protein